MKLSIVVICWNDSRVLVPCLRSIYEQTDSLDFEVLLADNGSSDGSVALVQSCFPQVRIVENGRNLGFGAGNNCGIRLTRGEYVLLLNPDTVVHDHALQRWVAFADRHPQAGAFGCRLLNPDGSFQVCARPEPTLARSLRAALGLRALGALSERLLADTYPGWDGRTERCVDWQMGAALLVRGRLLRDLGGFDEQFFYHFEEIDLCRRIRDAGYEVRFFPGAEIEHLGAKAMGRFTLDLRIETYRNRYRYFYKYHGLRSLRWLRWISILGLSARAALHRFWAAVTQEPAYGERAAIEAALMHWNLALDEGRFIEEAISPTPRPMRPAVPNGR